MIKQLYNKIFNKTKGTEMNIMKVAELPFEFDKDIRIKILSFGDEYIKFMYRDRNAEEEITILKPKNKSWKKIVVNPGGKLNIKLVRGKKNGSPQLLVV